MKKLLFCMLFLMLVCRFSYAETVHITTGEYPPFYSQSYKHHGVIPHIVTEAFALQGVEVQWQFMPWERALLTAKQLRSDASCCWAVTSERRKYYSYSEAVQTQEYVLFHLNDYAFDWQTVEDLQNIPLVATKGYSYGAMFEDAELAKLISVQRVPSDEMGLKMLQAGRAKLMAISSTAGFEILSELFTPEEAEAFTHHQKPIHVYQIHLVFSHEHDDRERLLRLFNNGLQQLIESGLYEQYYMESSRGDYEQ